MDLQIYIIGPASLQNELLDYALRKELAHSCHHVQSVSQVFEDTDDADKRKLLLVDHGDNYFEQVLADLEHYRKSDGSWYVIALYNLERELGIEHDALRRGIQGFFYKQDNLVLLLKGIKTLFSGEIWLSRDILVNMVLHSNIAVVPPAQAQAGLTKREIEILALVSMGSRNDEIAEKLYISPHTVKTHLYNLFKKINVDNRFQAALWAAQNL